MKSIEQSTWKRNRLTRAVSQSLGEFEQFEIDTKIELIQALIPLGLMALGDMLESEVRELAGARHGRGGYASSVLVRNENQGVTRPSFPW
jgi:hypothetical protein